MITSQLIISFHGLFYYPVTLLTIDQIFLSIMVPVIYMKDQLSLMIPIVSRLKSPLVLSSRSSLPSQRNLRKAYPSTDWSFIFLLAPDIFLNI